MVVRPRSVSHGLLDDGHLNPADEEVVAGEGDLSHHGDPGSEEEVIVIEEPEEEERAPARIVRAPRMPTQAEIDAHMATHLPHQDWCEICMKGRGRNTPHMRTKKKRGSEEEDPPVEDAPAAEGSGHGPAVAEEGLDEPASHRNYRSWAG